MAAQAGIEDGVINYPSGQMAVVVCKGDVGRVVTVYSDSSKPQVRPSWQAAQRRLITAWCAEYAI